MRFLSLIILTACVSFSAKAESDPRLWLLSEDSPYSHWFSNPSPFNEAGLTVKQRLFRRAIIQGVLSQRELRDESLENFARHAPLTLFLKVLTSHRMANDRDMLLRQIQLIHTIVQAHGLKSATPQALKPLANHYLLMHEPTPGGRLAFENLSADMDLRRLPNARTIALHWPQSLFSRLLPVSAFGTLGSPQPGLSSDLRYSLRRFAIDRGLSPIKADQLSGLIEIVVADPGVLFDLNFGLRISAEIMGLFREVARLAEEYGVNRKLGAELGVASPEKASLEKASPVKASIDTVDRKLSDFEAIHLWCSEALKKKLD